MQQEKAVKGSNALGAVRDAAISALISLGLFLPLVGFETVVNMRNELTLDTRWPLLFSMVALVFVVRLSYWLFAAPRLAQRKQRGVSASVWLGTIGKWFVPCAIGFVIVYPVLILSTAGFSGALKWVDNFAIQILFYVMLGWGL